MSNASKIRRSRDRWKQKAVNRGDALREARKTERRQSSSIAKLRESVILANKVRSRDQKPDSSRARSGPIIDGRG